MPKNGLRSALCIAAFLLAVIAVLVWGKTERDQERKRVRIEFIKTCIAEGGVLASGYESNLPICVK